VAYLRLAPEGREAMRFPDVTVNLTDIDGNAFVILGTVQRALKRGGADAGEIREFITEAQSGDYDNLLRTVMKWVEVS